MHRCAPEVYNKLYFLDNYFEKVSDVIFEFNMSEENNAIVEMSLFPNNGNLKDFISPKKYIKLKDKVKKYFEINLDTVSHLRPLFINTLLQEKLFGSNLVSMDESLHKKAVSEGLRIIGLETIDNNVQLFEKLDINTEIDQLLHFLKNISNSTNKLKAMESAYIKEDIQKLYKMSKKGIGKLKSILLYDRNVNFVDQLAKFGNERPYLACIGAGHLSGKYGVLRGLKKCGYIVKPIHSKDR